MIGMVVAGLFGRQSRALRGYDDYAVVFGVVVLRKVGAQKN